MNDPSKANPIDMASSQEAIPKRIDWQVAEQQSLEAHTAWLQSLTIAELFKLYRSLMRMALAQRDDSEGWRRLEEMRFQEKLALRRKMIRALKLDITDAE